MDKEIRHKGNMSRERIYNFILDYISKNGFAPSVREIADGTGFSSTSSVYRHLLDLEGEGKIQMKRKTTRAIKVVGYEFVKVEG